MAFSEGIELFSFFSIGYLSGISEKSSILIVVAYFSIKSASKFAKPLHSSFCLLSIMLYLLRYIAILLHYYKLCSYSYFFLSLRSGMVVQSSTAGLLLNTADRSPTRSAMPVVMEITVLWLMFCNAR